MANKLEKIDKIGKELNDLGNHIITCVVMLVIIGAIAFCVISLIN